MATHNRRTSRRRTRRRAEDSEAAGALRRRAGGGRDRAGERASMLKQELAAAEAGANRRPHRRPSGQGLGAHCDHSVRERGAKRLRGLLQSAGRQLPGRRRGRHRPRHALRVRWTTTRSCSSRRPMTATGTPTSTTSRRRFPNVMDSVLQLRGLAGNAQPGGRRTGSSSTRSRPRPGTSPIRT